MARISFMYADIYLYTVAVGVDCGAFSRSCGGAGGGVVCMDVCKVCFVLVWCDCIYVYMYEDNALVVGLFVLCARV